MILENKTQKYHHLRKLNLEVKLNIELNINKEDLNNNNNNKVIIYDFS